MIYKIIYNIVYKNFSIFLNLWILSWFFVKNNYTSRCEDFQTTHSKKLKISILLKNTVLSTVFFYFLLYIMIKYKLKWASIDYSEKLWKRVIVIPLVWRWINWKYDKYITMDEALPIVEGAVIDPNEKNSILSQKDRENFWKVSLF